jgi:hypothetical protein
MVAKGYFFYEKIWILDNNENRIHLEVNSGRLLFFIVFAIIFFLTSNWKIAGILILMTILYWTYRNEWVFEKNKGATQFVMYFGQILKKKVYSQNTIKKIILEQYNIRAGKVYRLWICTDNKNVFIVSRGNLKDIEQISDLLVPFLDVPFEKKIDSTS